MINLKNLQEINWDKMMEVQKLDMFKFRIDVKENDVNKCRVLPIILYLVGYWYCTVFKKIKYYDCKHSLSGSDVEEIPEINFYFQGINRLVGWVLCHINLCKLFNAKSIFIQIISSISNNLV